MFKTTVFAAAALATAIAATPISTASASQVNFNLSFDTPHGTFSFGNGNGGGWPQPASLSCFEAKQVLKSDFVKVNTVECNGSVYTFKVKQMMWQPYKTVKINRNTGNYWFA